MKVRFKIEIIQKNPPLANVHASVHNDDGIEVWQSAPQFLQGADTIELDFLGVDWSGGEELPLRAILRP